MDLYSEEFDIVMKKARDLAAHVAINPNYIKDVCSLEEPAQMIYLELYNKRLDGTYIINYSDCNFSDHFFDVGINELIKKNLIMRVDGHNFMLNPFNLAPYEKYVRDSAFSYWLNNGGKKP